MVILAQGNFFMKGFKILVGKLSTGRKMKITIVASLFTKGKVNIYAGHEVKLSLIMANLSEHTSYPNLL